MSVSICMPMTAQTPKLIIGFGFWVEKCILQETDLCFLAGCLCHFEKELHIQADIYLIL